VVPDNPPAPTGATWGGGVEPVIVTFDKPLQAVPAISAPAYGARLANFGQTIVSGSVLGSTLTLFRTADKASTGFNAVWYNGTPADLVGLDMQPVVPFSINTT